MADKEFLRYLGEQSRLRVLIVTRRGKVSGFLVQLETLIGEVWVPVARYDTAHGFAHLDILHHGSSAEKIRLVETDLNKALEAAFTDLLANAESYIIRYLKEI